ncbi:MAG: YdjY domain-containing protein [Planctomycetota bacterium]|jgi:hypothetical protein
MTPRLAATFFALAACCAAQGSPDGKQPPKAAPAAADPQKVLAEMKQQFQKEGIAFDLEKKTVSVPAVVNQPQDPIEYLLIHKKGKRHEAMFVTMAKPSVLNAALLLLGLVPGKNATYVEKQPAPTLEEVQAGADPIVVTPPQGEPFFMTVRWKDSEGKPVEHCVEDLLLDRTTAKSIVDCSWVYLGGRMAQIYRNEPEVYIADFEGNLISVCYLSPDNHLATMVHSAARDDQNWWTTSLLPAAETAVEFVFHRGETKLHAERRLRLSKAAGDARETPKDEDSSNRKN